MDKARTSEKLEPQRPDEALQVKKPYSKPALRRLGSVRELTQGTSANPTH
jgi:hypothetical protein